MNNFKTWPFYAWNNRGWVGPRAGLDGVEKRKLSSYICRKFSQCLLVVQSVV